MKVCLGQSTENCAQCKSRINSIFSDLNNEQLEQLTAHKITNTYKKGQTIFYESNPSKGIFCVASGQIKLLKNGIDGKDVVLKIAKGGDVLGVEEILSDKDYNVTAKVIDDATICFVDKKFITYLTKTDGDLAFKIINKLTDDLHNVENRISDQQNKNVRQRLSQTLLILSKTYGKETEQGILLDVKLTRAELASMISTSPETVMRLLSEFKDLNYIYLDGKRIYILDSDQLFEEAFISA